MFQDEARFGRINDVRRCWAPKPVRPLCQAMLTHEYTDAYAAVDIQTGELDSLILPHVNTHCMQLFLDEVGQRHPGEHTVMVLDGAALACQRRASTSAQHAAIEAAALRTRTQSGRTCLGRVARETIPQPGLRQPRRT